MSWLTSFSAAATLTDTFRQNDDRILLLAAGLFGEAGSIITEVKKMRREGAAYPHNLKRLTEEFGDFLWYYVRLVDSCDPSILSDLEIPHNRLQAVPLRVEASLSLGSAVGRVLELAGQEPCSELQSALKMVWATLLSVAEYSGISLEEAANANLLKTQGRWPGDRIFHPLFDEDYPIEEQIPRNLLMRFVERPRGTRIEVLLRCQDIGIGSRLTDNIRDPDGYRYHDIFHMAFAVFLGWSPVVRALLRCKRKSNSTIDENEDGARAIIVDEAVSAIVFNRAKEKRFFEGARQLDYDLLKNIQELVRGYEVDRVPLWQWETAILKGYEAFRLLRSNSGGYIRWDLTCRTFVWAPSNIIND